MPSPATLRQGPVPGPAAARRTRPSLHLAPAPALRLPPVPPPAPARGTPRETRIDLLRGLALAMIFVNHVPGTVYEHLTSRNFGFSDAAEAFVMIAGASAALAYGNAFAGGLRWPGVARVWSRAWTLYLVHILLSVVVLGLLAAFLRFGGVARLLGMDNFQFLTRDPLGLLIGLPVMTHQFGYINILPVYVLLLLAAPLVLTAARRRPWPVLCLSAALWAAAGVAGLNLPHYPARGGWFLNPLSWQLIFVIGVLIGLRLKEGRRLIPRHPLLTALALAYVVNSALWVLIPAVAKAEVQGLVALSHLGLPPLVTNFDKGWLHLPRLLHVLSLAYLVSILPGLAALSRSRRAWPLTVMGRQALPVFALGTILSFAGRGVLELVPQPGFLAESAVILGGLALLVGFAALVEAGRRAARPPKRG